MCSCTAARPLMAAAPTRPRTSTAEAWPSPSTPAFTGEEAYPFLVSMDIVRQLSPRVQRLLGFRSQYPIGSPLAGQLQRTGRLPQALISNCRQPERTVIKQPQAALVNGQHLDFIVVGAGISGLGATYNTHKRFPDHSFAVLEAMDGFGALVDASLPRRAFGQRLLHLRLQLQALGNRTRHRHGRRDPRLPGELIEENDLARHIHYGHKITAARWSSGTGAGRWRSRARIRARR